jgi:hypothetical protein
VPTITIPDATYAALSRKAAAVGVSPSEFIALTLGADPAPPTPLPSPDEAARQKAFEEMTAFVQSLAHLFPPGHETDVSREAMYREREDAQL